MLLPLTGRDENKIERWRVLKAVSSLNYWNGSRFVGLPGTARERKFALEYTQERVGAAVGLLIAHCESQDSLDKLGWSKGTSPSPSEQIFLDHGIDIRATSIAQMNDVSELNRMMSNYPAWKTVGFDTQRMALATRFRPYRKTGNFPDEEVEAVFAAVDLAEWGLLHKLPNCAVCKRFYVPSRGGQQTCSTKCSRKMDAAKPERKTARAEYQRNYYANNFSKM